jgi:hypothetical protein
MLTTDRLATDLRSELPSARADDRAEAAIHLGPNSGEEESNVEWSGARWAAEETSSDSDSGGQQKSSCAITNKRSFL